MRINPAWKRENQKLRLELAEEKDFYKDNKASYIEDMKTLKNELSKEANEWDCDLIDNMCRCAQERKINMNLSKMEIEHLKSCIDSLSLRIPKYY